MLKKPLAELIVMSHIGDDLAAKGLPVPSKYKAADKKLQYMEKERLRREEYNKRFEK